MKLMGPNYNWQPESLGRVDSNAPVRAANAEAQAAKAWGRLYEDMGKTATKIMGDISAKSVTEDVNGLYAGAMFEINAFENFMLTEQTLGTDSELMDGLGYNDWQDRGYADMHGNWHA